MAFFLAHYQSLSWHDERNVRRFFGASFSSRFISRFDSNRFDCFEFSGKETKTQYSGIAGTADDRNHRYYFRRHAMDIIIFIFVALPRVPHHHPSRPIIWTPISNKSANRTAALYMRIIYHHTSGGVRPCVRVRIARVSVRT